MVDEHQFAGKVVLNLMKGVLFVNQSEFVKGSPFFFVLLSD
jgi:hypothetical protein